MPDVIKLTQIQKAVMEGKICPYCSRPSIWVNSEIVYGLDYGMIYYCPECKAWAGTHKDNQAKSLGRLANKELRDLKKKAHESFDPIWQTGILSRKKAYDLLSERLSIPREFTHIGMFSPETCRKVIDIARELLHK